MGGIGGSVAALMVRGGGKGAERSGASGWSGARTSRAQSGGRKRRAEAPLSGAEGGSERMERVEWREGTVVMGAERDNGRRTRRVAAAGVRRGSGVGEGRHSSCGYEITGFVTSFQVF